MTNKGTEKLMRDLARMLGEEFGGTASEGTIMDEVREVFAQAQFELDDVGSRGLCEEQDNNPKPE